MIVASSQSISRSHPPKGRHGIDSLNINLNKIGESVLVQVENEIMNEVGAIVDDDEWKLIRELRLLEEILDFLWVLEKLVS